MLHTQFMYLYLFGSYPWLQKLFLSISCLASNLFVYNYCITIKNTKPTFRRLVKKEDNIFDKEHQKTGESIAFHGLSWQFALFGRS